MATKNIVGHLVYKITGDSKELDQGLKKSQDSTAKFTKFMKSVLGIGGAVVAVKMLIGVGKDLIAAYSQQEQAESRLAAAIRARGGDVDALMEQYKAFSSGVQAVTTVGDEQTLGLIQIGESLGITRDKMQEATQGAIGLSKAFGIDMNTAMRGIALAYEGNYAQLSRYIPALRTAGDEAERQAVLQEAMANGFEIAKAEAETGTGAMLQLKNAIGDLKEEGGAMLLDFLKPSIKSLSEFVAKTTAAIAESRRLKKVAEELSEGKKVAAVDELALIHQRLKDLQDQRQIQIDMYGEATEGIESTIAGLKAQEAALVSVARYEAMGQEARRKGNAEAAAAAEAQAKRQQELVDWIKGVNDEYAKTEQGQKDILNAEIAKWEYELTQANVYKPKIQAILDMLYELRDANKEITDTWKQQVEAMAAETDAAMADYQLRLDAEAAYNEEIRQINDERRAAEKVAEAAAAAQRDALLQTSLDFVQQLLSMQTGFYRAQLEAQIADLDRKLERDLVLVGENEEEQTRLKEEYEKERAKMEYQAALATWKLQLMQALAGAAEVAINALKMKPFIPLGLASLVLAGILTAVQLATIRKQKPVPSFAGGADFIVPPGYPNDSYPMRVESGEHVVVEPRGRAIMQAPLIIQIDSAPVYRGLLMASKDGLALLAERAVVKGR